MPTTPEPSAAAPARSAASRPLLAVLAVAAAVLTGGGGALAQMPLDSKAFGDPPAFSPPLSPSGAAFPDPAMPRLEGVETFDPVARAQLLARDLPLFWSGTYQPFGSSQSVPVQLRLARPRTIGLMVDLRGEMRVGEVVSPVQGNLNARSDQLDLLLLRPVGLASLEPGGVFIGLQGLSLSGWQASRLINPGGRLELSPLSGPAAPTPSDRPAAPIRGLW
ncbi:hypothetical protein KBY96_03280 [Cyanobium sp. ATX 6A2]|uniref:hypothetical protein n=1 Tax=Cyanobium sp. ATX 6A2 TaxID=2823700 RepID=UPI0020CDFE91|nr:hypothetical protein [Cyanobium sp. ATX 6A2]MCP9886957.1 hypothetical protein [Cyanobium sp. ATX 6A2]